MPYIKQADRTKFDKCIEELQPTTTGELNYCLTSLIQHWIKNKGICYDTLNSAIGVVGCVKEELYRRCIAPYEDSKIVVNGDVNFLK